MRTLRATLFLSLILPMSLWAQVPDPNLRNALAPTGTLRAVFLASNPVQGRVNASTGVVTGPAAEIVRELAQRIGVPSTITGLDGVPAVMDAVNKGTADIGFLAFDVARASQINFTGL